MTQAAPLTLTPEALAAAERLAREEPGYAGQAVRVYIEGKGCDGFYYGVSFDAPAPNDASWTQGALTIVVDPDSLQFLHGSLVTWVNDERGQGFLVENPNQRKFRGKFYKKKEWKDRLTAAATSSSQ